MRRAVGGGDGPGGLGAADRPGRLRLPQMQITGSTCRLSVPVRFEARRCLRRPVAAVTAVELQDPPEGPQPSLILRRMAEGETLWDIARQYRTDEEAIRAANELTEDRPEGMLLIPRVR